MSLVVAYFFWVVESKLASSDQIDDGSSISRRRRTADASFHLDDDGLMRSWVWKEDKSNVMVDRLVIMYWQSAEMSSGQSFDSQARG